MSRIITSRSEIPDAAYYVCANDSFMSGWARAKDTINTIICPCQTYEEMRHVESYAQTRSEMKRIRICTTKPRLRDRHVYSLFTPETATAWYPKPDQE